MNINDLKIIKEDLDYLAHEWTQGLDDPSVRRSSTVLRMLLVQGNLSKAWRHFFEGEPKITAPSLAKIFSVIPKENIVFAQAGGGKAAGVEIQFGMQIKTISAANERDLLYALGPELQKEEFPLSKFIESPCIIINGEEITRREVISYVANTEAAHLDAGHEKETKRKFLNLASTRDHLKVLERDVALYELLSIGQHLIISEDIKLLKKELDKLPVR